jgi:ATP-binding cassette subfamily B protein
MMGGGQAEKAMNFKSSSRRLLRMLAPERLTIGAVLVAGAASVGLSVAGPKILGHATNLIFAGAIGAKMDPRVSKEQVVEGMRQSGQGRLADMLSAMDVIPGHGIDFTKVLQVLGWVAAIYLVSALFGVVQGRLTTMAVQRTVRRLREQVEAKLSRLPLRYFDQQPLGEVLSRATNDTDNIAQTLQQTQPAGHRDPHGHRRARHDVLIRCCWRSSRS